MAARGLSPDELTAGAIVTEILGGLVVPRDIEGAADETHDMDIVEVPRLGRIALEVTSAREQAIISMMAAAFKDRPMPSLARDWILTVPADPPASIAAIVRGLEPELRSLEEAGVSDTGARIGPRAHHGEAEEIVERVRSRGIERARAWSPPRPGEDARLMFMLSRGLVAGGPEVNPLVEECAAANIEKLRRAEVEERHLFVWVHAGEAELALFSQPPPDSSPTLPEGLDVVWAATHGSVRDGCERLWRVRRGGRWEALDHESS